MNNMYNWIYPNPIQFQKSVNLIAKSIESIRDDELRHGNLYNYIYTVVVDNE